MSVLVVTAMSREARAVGGGAMAVGAGIRGVGRTGELLDASDFDSLIIAGICGALDPSLRVGDVVLSRRVLAPSEPELTADSVAVEAARRALGHGSARRSTFVSSTLLTVPAPTIDEGERCDLWNAYGAAGVDMETYWLAAVAAERGVPWLAVRAVSDAADARLPNALASWRGEEDDRRVAVSMAARPWQWPSMLRLALDTRSALQSLAAATQTVAAALDGTRTAIVDERERRTEPTHTGSPAA